MYHFFVSPTDISGHDIYIRGADHNHIKNVLRMKKGETLSVSDGVSENEYRCHIEGFEEDAVHLRLDFIKEADTELPVEICLLQGLPKADKMEFIIQKAVELGIGEVIPVATGRSIARSMPFSAIFLRSPFKVPSVAGVMPLVSESPDIARSARVSVNAWV